MNRLDSKKQGRPTLLGHKMLQQQIVEMRERGTPITLSIVIGIGVGFLFRHGKPDKEIKEPELTLLGCRWFEANEFYKEKSQFKV